MRPVAWARRHSVVLSCFATFVGTLALIASPAWVFFPVIFTALGVVLVALVVIAVQMDRDQ